MKEKITAIVNDRRLMDLAKYKCSNGMLVEPTPEALLKEFGAMKKRILSGRTTVSKMEVRIYNKYGVQEDIPLPPMSQDPMGFEGQLPQQLGPGNTDKPDKKIEGFGSNEDSDTD